ncbi:thermonuclease family protein [Salicibibacter kimchii]|nr:thermonuclease family protein [Salicibibacter kimchii]
MFRFLIVICSMMILVGCQRPSDDDPLQGTVVNIVDGDTFDVNIQGMGDERVRPIMVDAPEICHQHDPPACEPEPYGEEATAFATDVLLGETVYLEQDESERDQYDRMLFYVYVDEDQMFQEMLLEEGLAEVVVYEPDVRYEEAFYEIQEEAQEREEGMWGGH